MATLEEKEPVPLPKVEALATVALRLVEAPLVREETLPMSPLELVAPKFTTNPAALVSESELVEATAPE